MEGTGIVQSDGEARDSGREMERGQGQWEGDRRGTGMVQE